MVDIVGERVPAHEMRNYLSLAEGALCGVVNA